MEQQPTPLRQTIGRFRVEALLGAGGMGEVYRALDPTLQRTVAVKVVRPDLDRPDSLARLYREAQACARLQHPNIVTVYEAGEIEGVVYIAMEYLKGDNLATLLARGSLTFEEKIDILVHVLDALEHAHAEGVVHRDVKPSNVQRLPDGSVKLMDFGVARVARAETITATSAIVGTPHYASPEQLRGQPIDRRTDIYSTGALAYEMVTGRRPFQGEDNSVTTVILKVISEPVPPMDVSWSRMFPEVEQIVLRAMAKSPDDRFQTAHDMRAALSGFLAGAKSAIRSAQSAETLQATLDAVPRSAVSTRSSLAPVAAAPVSQRTTAAPVAPPLAVPSVSTTSPAPARSRSALYWGAGVVAAAVIATVLLMRQPARGVAPGGSDGQPPAPVQQADQPAAAPVPAAPAPATGMPPQSAAGSTTARLAPAPSVTAAPAAPALVEPSAPAADARAGAPDATGARELFFGTLSLTALGRGSDPLPAGAPAASNAGLRYRLVQQSPTGGEMDVEPGTVFRSGDRVRFTFESNIDGYLYVVQEGSSGRWTVLFPSPDINGGRNAIRRFERHAVPSQGWFQFDANPGTEHIFVFLSREPLAQLPGFNRPVTRMETLTASVVDDLQRSIKSRDLVFAKDPPAAQNGTGRGNLASYVVNREEVGKAVSASIQLTHGQ